eukprot:CAMPEP_0194418704 /NCGR_PEP_ID=MMETSP0176-20130528/17880_1 /TAXON_ID=216777 /ORGANISM="Proboscia alata, Strain PI-D3" /LENGTH=266 /DNA_ID=CAMNT_0039225345 /DNA_START=31 /DNA_END=831 /DNA_ORIENTATION=+
MRTWKRAPKIGKEVSEFSRKYFLTTAVIALAVVSSYFWSGFPYDNLCDDGIITRNSTNSEYIGGQTIHSAVAITEGDPQLEDTKDRDPRTYKHIAVSDGDNMYQFCNQNLAQRGAFPALPRHQIEGYEWMTDEQEMVTSLFGWTSIGIVVLILSSFIHRFFMYLKAMYHSSYESCGDDQFMDYSTLDSVDAYIPQVKSPAFTYPLIACNISKNDMARLSWNDPDQSHGYYQLSNDVPKILRSKDFTSKTLFSSFTYWPPIAKRSEG